MKHAKDPGTIELPLPKKKGRPPIYSSALSPAERARRYRRNKVERFGQAFEQPASAETPVLCQALAWLDSNADAVSSVTREILMSDIAAELATRYHKP
ncbi:hypothetical protein [Lysobacter sp. 1R34A]|uniref:hypothetical protein n=1 Tax=Lysobacter sp. 1R34A TaxID=3445786 RepID=UPI003EEEEA16